MAFKIKKLERGSASLFLDLEDGKLKVYHGESVKLLSPQKRKLLFEREAKEGDWDKIWDKLKK
jgi:hypothetical protein